jgi:WD40 repeat protein
VNVNSHDDGHRYDTLATKYLAALEDGDFAAMEALWQQAQSDPRLAAMLHELNELMAAEPANSPAMPVLPAPSVPKSRFFRGRVERFVPWAVAACLLVSLVILVTDHLSAMAEQRRLQEQFTVEHALRQADEKQAKVIAHLQMCRAYSYVGSLDRREKMNELLKGALAIRRTMANQDHAADFLDAEIRSVYALAQSFVSARAVDSLKVTKPTEDANGVFMFASHPLAMLPDGTGMAVGSIRRPFFWKRGVKPEWQRFDRADIDESDRPARMQYSPDGNLLAFANQREGGLVIWDRECSRELRTLIPAKQPGGVVLALAFTADSSRLYALRSDGAIQSWKLPSFESDKDNPWILAGNLDRIEAGRFSDDLSRVAVTHAQGKTIVYGRDGKQKTACAYGDVRVQSLAWSPDQKTLAVGLSSGNVIAFDERGIVLFRAIVSDNGVSRLQFHPEGNLLFASYRGQMTRVFDARTGELLLTTNAMRDFSQDGKMFAAAIYDTALFMEILPSRGIRSLGGTSANLNRIKWAKSAPRFVTLSADFEIRVWDCARSDPLVNRFREPQVGRYFGYHADVALSDDGSQVAYAAGGKTDVYLSVRDVATGKELGRWGLPAGFDFVAPAGPGKFLSVREEFEGPEKKTLKTVARLFEIGNPDCLSERVLRKSIASDVALYMSHDLTPDGRYFAWGGPRKFGKGGRRVEVFDVATGARIANIPCTDAVNDGEPFVHLAADGKYLWYQSNKKVYRVELSTTKPAIEVDGWVFAMPQDGRWTARQTPRGFGADQLTLFSEKGGKPILHFTNPNFSGPTGQGEPASPDGRYFVYGSTGGLLTLVDLREIDLETSEIDRKLGTAAP